MRQDLIDEIMWYIAKFSNEQLKELCRKCAHIYLRKEKEQH